MGAVSARAIIRNVGCPGQESNMSASFWATAVVVEVSTGGDFESRVWSSPGMEEAESPGLSERWGIRVGSWEDEEERDMSRRSAIS